MIDRARIEHLLSYVERAAQSDDLMVHFFNKEAHDVLTDYLALRDIVEALAANDPTGQDWQGADTCPLCDEYRGGDEGERRPHGEDCPRRLAVELMGNLDQSPASIWPRGDRWCFEERK